MRDGLDPGDVLLLMGFLWRVPDGPTGRQQADRMMAIVIDGLRPRRNHLSSLDIRRSANTLPPV